MRLALTVLVALAFGAASALAARTTGDGDVRTVTCGEIIQDTKFPYIGNSRPQYRYRQVLAAASVPERFLQQVAPTNSRPWAYWRKAGFVVRAGRVVTVTVPDAWRTRAAITWGNGGGAPVASLRFTACPGPRNVGHAYAGGFYVRAPACVPLSFTVGNRTATVRFGVGHRC